jgi:chemotaxis protein MotB
LSALVLLYEPFKRIVRTNNLVQAGLGAARRIFELLDEPGEDPLEVNRRVDVVVISGLPEQVRMLLPLIAAQRG